MCPTHNSLGAVKLLVATLTPKGSLIPSNAAGRIDVHAPRGIEIAVVRDTIEPIALTTREERERAIREAGWSTLLLRSADVTIDLLTDSGTTAMSTDQWAGYDAACATPATSEAYPRFGAMREIHGYEHILPPGRPPQAPRRQRLLDSPFRRAGNRPLISSRTARKLAICSVVKTR